MVSARLKRLHPTFILTIAAVVILPGCLLHRNRGADRATAVNPGDQPDKILFEKATHEIQHGRFDVGRLTLQTLINTYPDSEFLAKAKLAIADSYYSEGGVSGLTQAEQEYRDFITFFPTAPEAPEAQFRVGMAHYRLMAKADRDRTEARLAEVEFKEFLLKYPDSPMMPRVKRRLRETQEVLAQGEYRTAQFYYMRGAYPAAKSRFQEIIERYPNYSRGDNALWYVGQSLEHLKRSREAIPYYSRILTDFPLSPLTEEAKGRLVAMHQPVPRPTKATLARAQADALRRRASRDPLSLLARGMSSSPDVSATRHGPVRLGTPQPGQVEVAKTGTPGAGSATITVQPVGDASLNSGKAIDPKTGAATAGPASGNSQAQASATASTKDETSDIPPTPKKKRKILRRLLPF